MRYCRTQFDLRYGTPLRIPARGRIVFFLCSAVSQAQGAVLAGGTAELLLAHAEWQMPAVVILAAMVGILCGYLVVPEKVILGGVCFLQTDDQPVNSEHRLGFFPNFHQRRPKDGQ